MASSSNDNSSGYQATLESGHSEGRKDRTHIRDAQRFPDRARSGSQLSPVQSVQSPTSPSQPPTLLSPLTSSRCTEGSTDQNLGSQDGSDSNKFGPTPFGSGGFSPRPPSALQAYAGFFRRSSGSLTGEAGSQSPNLPLIYTPDWTALHSGHGITHHNAFVYTPPSNPFSSASNSQPLSSHDSAGGDALSPSFSEITNTSSQTPSSANSRALSIARSGSNSHDATNFISLPTSFANTRSETNRYLTGSALFAPGLHSSPEDTSNSTPRQPCKRAVLIGVTYAGHDELPTVPGHAVSVQRLFHFLINYQSYNSGDMWVLCDQYIDNLQNAKVTQPDTSNISKALRWLVSDSQSGDFAFFFFSGEIMRDIATDGNMVQEAVYALLASDHPTGPLIWGSDIEHMVLGISRGARVTILLDCQWSWDIVRLPYICLPFKYDKYSPFEVVGALTPNSWHMPELSTLLLKALQGLTPAGKDREQYEREQEEEYLIERMNKFETSARVICFAASPVKYKRFKRKFIGINPLEKGEYTNAFVRVIESMVSLNQPLRLRSVLLGLGEVLSPHGSMKQTPQICGTHRLNLNQVVHL